MHGIIASIWPDGSLVPSRCEAGVVSMREKERKDGRKEGRTGGGGAPGGAI